MRDNKGRFIKGTASPHRGDHSWVNSGSFKAGHTVSVASRKSMSLKKRGKKLNYKSLEKYIKEHGAWNKNRKSGPMSIETRRKIGLSNSGSKSHLWRGGISSTNEKIRSSFDYKLWRIAIYKRDHYTCVFCGQVGGNLNADHIKPFSLYPESRFEIDNGRTLCLECHKKTDTYLSGSVRKENRGSLFL